MIRILTDTAADCLPSEIEQLKIDLIELPVTFDGELESCRDVEVFWNKLVNGGVARTSQPSREELRKHFESAKQDDCSIIYICISSRMSGTYESALAVKEEVDYDKVYVVDSLNATTAEKILVLEACKLRDNGVEAKDIVEQLNELRHRVRMLACIDTLKYLARGGRISKSTATIGNLMNLKPIITFVNGEIQNSGKSIGTHIAIRKLLEKMRSDKIDWSYAPIPLYSCDSKNCLSFVEHANQQGMKIDSKLATPIGATIGTHIGPGGFGIVYVLQK